MSTYREIAEHMTDRRRMGLGPDGAIWSPADALAVVRKAVKTFGEAQKVSAWFWVLNRSCAEQPDPVEMAVATLAYLGPLARAEAIARAEAHAAVIHTEEAA